MRILRLILALIAMGHVECYAQEDDCVRFNTDPDVLDSHAVNQVIFVHKRMDLPDVSSAVDSLDKMIPVDRAVIHGSPPEDLRLLLEWQIGHPIVSELFQVSAVRFDENGFVWKVTYVLFNDEEEKYYSSFWDKRKPRFHIFVKPDGSLLEPERYLCSCTSTGMEPQVFSAMKFEDIAPFRAKAEVDGEDALKLAREALSHVTVAECVRDVALTGASKPAVWRFHQQRLVEVPLKTRNDRTIELGRVWQIEFRLDGHSNARPFIVWVSLSGVVSKLSTESWTSQEDVSVSSEAK